MGACATWGCGGQDGVSSAFFMCTISNSDLFSSTVPSWAHYCRWKMVGASEKGDEGKGAHEACLCVRKSCSVLMVGCGCQLFEAPSARQTRRQPLRISRSQTCDSRVLPHAGVSRPLEHSDE